MGAHRKGAGGGHDEREQTLNQLLSEMDGFEPNENVIVILKIHARGKPISDDVDFHKAAQGTPGFSGAEDDL